MADGAPNFRYQDNRDTNRATSNRHTIRELGTLENQYAGINTPHAEITDQIIGASRLQVADVLNDAHEDASEQVFQHVQEQQRELNRPTGRSVVNWLTRRARRAKNAILGRDYYEPADAEVARRERFHNAPTGEAAADLRARREVGKPAYMSAEDIWRELDNDPRHTELYALLNKRLGSDIMTEAQDHPELLFTLRFIVQNIPAGVNRVAYIRAALDGEEQAHHGRSAEELEEISGGANEKIAKITEGAAALRKRCRHGNRTVQAELAHLDAEIAATQARLTDANETVRRAQDAVSRYTDEGQNVPPVANTNLATANSARDRIEKELADHRGNRHSLTDLRHDLHEHATDLIQDLTRFYVDPHHAHGDDHGAEHGHGHDAHAFDINQFPEAVRPQIRALVDLSGHLDPAHDAPAGAPNPLNFIAQGGFKDAWTPVRTNMDAALKTAKDNHHEHHEVHTITPAELLYKVYYRNQTQDVDHGGVLPNGTQLNAMQLNAQRNRSLLFTRFALSEAKDATTIEANRVRAEILTRSRMNKGDRVNFLPNFQKILETFRYLQVSDARPFAKLILHENITRAELRAEMRKGNLSVETIPVLIANLERTLQGNDSTILKDRDVPLVLAMIRNLRILRDEQMFRNIMAGPGSFEDKMKKVIEGDTAEEDARNGINEAVLFATLTDKKFVKTQEKAIMEAISARVKSGELGLGDAMKELKEQGLNPGRGTWAKFVALRSGANIVNTWKNVSGKGPFAWLKKTVVTGYNGVKKGGKWLLWTNPVAGAVKDSVSYSFNPFTMKDNYPVVPPIFKGGGHGHGGDHGGGDHGGGGHGGGH